MYFSRFGDIDPYIYRLAEVNYTTKHVCHCLSYMCLIVLMK